MGGYKPIFKTIWKDPDFLELDSDSKLVFIYLFSNEQTRESGIYPISFRTISHETAIPLERVEQLLLNHSIKNIYYDHATRHVFVLRARKYNTGGSPKLIEKSILRDFENSADCNLWFLFIILYPQFLELILNHCETVGKPFPIPSKTDFQPVEELRYVTLSNISYSLLKTSSRGKIENSPVANLVKNRLEELKNSLSSETEPVNPQKNSSQATPDKLSEPQKENEGKDTGKKKKPRKIDYTSSFLELWAIYPNKANKFKAFKAWSKIKEPGKIIGVMAQAISQQTIDKARLKGNGDFCPEWPHLSTWLNGRRWEDEPLEATTKKIHTPDPFAGEQRPDLNPEEMKAARQAKGIG